MVMCSACGGTGFEEVNVEIPCAACDATGRVLGETCVACGGAGKLVAESTVPCELCVGTGLVKYVPRD